MVSSGQQQATVTTWQSQVPGPRLPSNPQKPPPRQATAGRAQRRPGRPALTMQPIGHGQPANHAIPQHQGNLGSVFFDQRSTPIQQPVIQHAAASTHNVISTPTASGSSIPNIVANPYFATRVVPPSFTPRKWQPDFRHVSIQVHLSSHFLEFFQSRRCSRSTRGPRSDSKFFFNDSHLTSFVIHRATYLSPPLPSLLVNRHLSVLLYPICKCSSLCPALRLLPRPPNRLA